MSTCASGAVIQVAESDLTSWSWDTATPADLVTFSRSRVESPDPPPPKA